MPSELFRFGDDFELDRRAYELRRGGTSLKLERIPMELLFLLVERKGELVTRDEIIERIWGKDVFLDTDNSINAAIRKIRLVLKDDPEQPRFLQTVTGKGYRFVAPVEEARGAPAARTRAPGQDEAVGPGLVISHYRVEEKIASGGMGDVFQAEDLRLGRRVALKFLSKKFANDSVALERFLREARAASSLNHPNICTIYEVEEHDGSPVMVMELLEGETLRQRISRAPVQMEEVLDVGIHVASALKAAHDNGIIHRDIKPGNILISRDGQVKVLDFGLAKLTAGHRVPAEDIQDPLTREGVLPGTAQYMSPEQVQDEELDGRSDLFSLGIVLYEMAAGKKPFTGKNLVATSNAILSVRPVAPSSVNPAVPAGLDAVIARAMEKKRERRYQSAADMRADLEALKRDTDSPRLPVSVAAGGTEGVRRFGRVGVLVAAAVMVLSVGGYFYVHRTPKLTDKDTIVLADFANSTGDSVFDGALRQGLSVQLEQSPFLSIVSDQQIQHTLELMGQKPDAKLTPEIAQDLCQRMASAAVLEGSIAQIGTPYLLTVKAVNCSNGATLASAEAEASDKNHVLDALGKTASEMRSKLGESLSTVQKFDKPLDEATTPSLEALKAFSSGRSAASPQISIPLLKHAVELDPNFAVAYAWLGIWYTSIGEPSIAASYTGKAYKLRERASEPEKYFVSAIYYKEVPGDMEKAEQTCKLWMQAYPREEMPHTYLSGAIYPAMGRYDGVIAEAKEAIRLKPDYAVPYVFLMEGYMALNRLDDANAIYRQAFERNLYHHYQPSSLYHLAFLQNDAAGMRQQVTRSGGQPGVEDTLLAYEADTAAYYGHLRDSEELTRRAMESAERAEKKEIAAGFSATSGIREALFGNADEARRRATMAMKPSAGVDALYASALAFAYAGETGRAQALADELNRRFPEATTVQFDYLPSVRAKLALNRGNPSEALEMLRAALPYELGQTTFSGEYAWNGLYPAYVRGEAHLAARQGAEAVAEFQKILDHRGIVWNSPLGALAHLQLGRAYAMQGDTTKARAAYNDFLSLWKEADPDIPVFEQAKAEYARLQ